MLHSRYILSPSHISFGWTAHGRVIMHTIRRSKITNQRYRTDSRPETIPYRNCVIISSKWKFINTNPKHAITEPTCGKPMSCRRNTSTIILVFGKSSYSCFRINIICKWKLYYLQMFSVVRQVWILAA